MSHYRLQDIDDLAAMAMADEVGGVQVAVSLTGPIGRLRINQASYLSFLGYAAEPLKVG